MRILDKYIGLTVAGNTLVALLVLVSLRAFIGYMDELGDAGKNDYGVLQALIYIGLSVPRYIYDFFPTATLLGCMLGLGVMASNSELVVIRTSGVSILRITGSVLKTGAVLMLIIIFIGEILAPAAERYSQTYRAEKMDDRITLKSDHGFWARDGLSYINIKTVLPGEKLRDIHIYEFDKDHQLRISTYAQSAEYKDNSWILEGIRQSYITKDKVTTKKIAKASWDALLNPDLINVVSIKPESLSAWALRKYISYLDSNGLNTDRYELAFWNKLVAPFSTAVMMILAIPFVFGPLRSVSMGQRALVGIMVGIGFYLINQSLGHMSQIYNINPVFSAVFPTIVFFSIAVFFIRRLR